MRYKTKRKTGTYEHFCFFVLAQGSWKEKDRESIRNIALEQRMKFREFDYHFYDRLTYRDSDPENSLCTICTKIFGLFAELSDNKDNILYQGHHYVEPEDYPYLLEFSKMLLDHEKVKKLYVLDIDVLNEFKVEEINNFSYEDIRALISEESCTIEEFENILLSNNFKQRFLYDIIKTSYY
ncbi:MAG: hypothetical protein ACTSQF_10405 [Candidatus Heimdallarchaeaceae archaeon]